MVVAAVGLLMLTLLNSIASLAVLVTATVALSFGVAMVVTLSTDLVVASVPPERAGAAAAISETGSEFGGALGIAILGSAGAVVYRSAMAGIDTNRVSTEVLASAKATLAGAIAAAGQLSNADGAMLLHVAERAFTRSLQTVGLLAALIALAVAVVLFARLRPSRLIADGGQR
jgi:DHA2 family multidrug resistance protein-like MFS transporter